MKLATIKHNNETVAVRIDGDTATSLGVPDIGALLQKDNWEEYAATASGEQFNAEDLSYAQLVTTPNKVICVGHNYETHIREMGRDIPSHPTLFGKHADTLTGPFDPVTIPAAGQAKVDWEAELTIVIGKHVRAVSEEDAADAIAGYTVLNDISIRDWQMRTLQWMQGKAWDKTTPLGPVMVTAEDFSTSSQIWTEVDGETKQSASIEDLVFNPAMLVSYISTFTQLRPGDIIATGTTGGVGHAMDPPQYLSNGSVVSVGVEGIGATRNEIIFE